MGRGRRRREFKREWMGKRGEEMRYCVLLSRVASFTCEQLAVKSRPLNLSEGA